MQSLLLYLQTFSFMKLVIFLALFTPFLLQSQTYEVGGYLGMANYIGDVGKTLFVRSKKSGLVVANDTLTG